MKVILVSVDDARKGVKARGVNLVRVLRAMHAAPGPPALPEFWSPRRMRVKGRSEGCSHRSIRV